MGGAAGGFVESGIIPGVEREFEIEDGEFVGAGVQEDGFVGVDFRRGGFGGAGFEDTEAGDGGRDEQGATVAIADMVIVVVVVEGDG